MCVGRDASPKPHNENIVVLYAVFFFFCVIFRTDGRKGKKKNMGEYEITPGQTKSVCGRAYPARGVGIRVRVWVYARIFSFFFLLFFIIIIIVPFPTPRYSPERFD